MGENEHSAHYKKQKPHDISTIWDLPLGQQRAVLALIGSKKARTYRQAAQVAKMSLGTMFAHLRRVRLRHPEIYEDIRAIRLGQLAKRHKEAVVRAQAHSRAYFHRKANYRYYERFGHWPWERW